MKRIKFAAAMLAAVAMSGCMHTNANDKLAHYKDIPAPSVPPPPALKSVAIDDELRRQAKDELLNEVLSPDAFLRSNAVEGLSEVAPELAEGPITQGLGDSDPAVRYASAIAAGQLKLKSAYVTLLAHVNDDDLRVQAAVRYALHRLGDRRFSHDLEKLAGNPDPRVRGSTVFVLGLLGEPSATAILGPMTADHSPAVRIQVAEALWRLGDERGLDDLVGFSVSAYPDDQMVALVALAERGDRRVIEHVRGGMISEYPEVALSAARAMGMLGSDEGWQIAVPSARSKDTRQRLLAAMAMGAIGRCDLQKPLKELLTDPKPEVRIAAATGILELKPAPGASD
jgi:HEAT repeat protein